MRRSFRPAGTYTVRVPETTADGTPGFAAAAQLIGRMARQCYDDLGGG
jgi:hypothetical protein